MTNRILAFIALVACAFAAGCGGYPMTVDSRTPPTGADLQKAQQEQMISQSRQLSRGRGAY